MEILLCTNGASSHQPALEYGMWLAKLLDYRVVLLGVVEKRGGSPKIECLVDETSRRMVERGISCRSMVVTGPAEGVIARGAARGEVLTVVGSLGRSGWQRFWRGSSFRRLMDAIHSPLLYVPAAHLQLRRILLCTGGLHYAQGVTGIVDRIARASHADVTLLHITAHGWFNADMGETILYLLDKTGGVAPVTATQLIERLDRLQGARGLPHFALLSTCDSCTPEADAAGALGGLAQRLVRELGMPAVIAMTQKVGMETANRLSAALYTRLRDHGEPDRARSFE